MDQKEAVQIAKEYVQKYPGLREAKIENVKLMGNIWIVMFGNSGTAVMDGAETIIQIDNVTKAVSVFEHL